MAAARKRDPRLLLFAAVVVVVVSLAQMWADRHDTTLETARADSASSLELPCVQSADVVIEHTGFTLSYSNDRNTPRWVAWQLTADEVDGGVRRSSEFFEDPAVEEAHRVSSSDYRGSGYDRGHMCPAGDMQWDAQAMHECFYMSNMCPQDHYLNGGPWKKLEESCRRWASQEGCVYVACGPIYNKKHPATIGQRHKVAVPDAFFKVVLSIKAGSEKAIGFVYKNSAERQTMEGTAMSVDEVERLTGLDFFASLPDALEEKVEASYNLRAWN